MLIDELSIPGCYIIKPRVLSDERGSFVKIYHNETFFNHGLGFNFQEEFYSVSKKNVLRGLHFQSPPAAHNKLVYCPKGAVLDYIVDLRINSPTFHHHLSIELNENNGVILYLPIGIAHGFLSLEENSLMIYKTDHIYAPDLDNGISFNSCGIELPIDSSEVIMSNRDMAFNSLEEYKSEFIYEQ